MLSQWQQNTPLPADLLDSIDSTCGLSLPEDYKDFLRLTNGGEGWVGDDYVIFWKAEDLKLLNEEYESATYAPDLLLFGSNGGGEAFAFDLRHDNLPLVRVPFVGMDVALAMPVSNSFSELFALNATRAEIQKPNPNYRGMELFEIQPIILGGSPTDPTNKTWLTRSQHIEAVRWWNATLKRLRQEKHGH